MVNILFLSAIALIITILFTWSMKSLQKEKWQILGTIPRHKGEDGSWQGTNFTYYGFFTGVAATFACGIGLILFGSQSVALTTMLVLALAIMLPCFAAAKLVARVVEKKEATLSIGGASFIGILFTPWLIVGLHHFYGLNIEIVTAMAVISIAYTFGESLGRLACLSFGCCYGKRISEIPAWMGKLFGRFQMVFSGDLKKITYAHGMNEEPVLPIQGITSIIYATIGLISIYLFIKGYHTAAFLLSIIVTQVWRLLSEFLRADYRGEGKISAYQIMGGVSVLYILFIAWLFPIQGVPSSDILAGLKIFWNPGVILFLEVVFISTFIFTGKSQVTGATMTFCVHTQKI